MFTTVFYNMKYPIFLPRGVLLGKVLRIDVDVPSNSTEPYRIPSDNPFVGEEGSRPEIFAYGIRNIWRCDLDEGDPITGKDSIHAFYMR